MNAAAFNAWAAETYRKYPQFAHIIVPITAITCGYKVVQRNGMVEAVAP